MTDAPERLEIPESLAGERIDRVVALLTGWGRADVQRLLSSGAIVVEGEPAAKSRRVGAGEVVELRDAPRAPRPPGPEAMPVEVRYEDEHVLVVAKAAGVVVHPGSGHRHGTLVQGLLARDPSLAGVGDPARPGIVHRLDRDTSGLLVVARTRIAHEALVAAIAARAVERDYLALVWGVPEARRGVVDAPIGRSQARRTRMAVKRSGKEARTRYEVRETFDAPETALLGCRLETGRTHQIRVHLAAIGHPVVGDATYGGSRESLPLARPFLHAARLAFDHPVLGTRVEVAEPLPDDLDACLLRLRARA